MAELEQLIVRTESELSELKRLRRAKLGGLAAVGRPRKRKFKVEDVLEAYARACGPDGRPLHGARRATAKQLGMTERHLGRVLAGNRELLERILGHRQRRGPRS